MSKVADSIHRGLEQAVAYAKGGADRRRHRVQVPKRIDVRTIRTRLGMTQEEFAGRFGFSVNTLPVANRQDSMQPSLIWRPAADLLGLHALERGHDRPPTARSRQQWDSTPSVTAVTGPL